MIYLKILAQSRKSFTCSDLDKPHIFSKPITPSERAEQVKRVDKAFQLNRTNSRIPINPSPSYHYIFRMYFDLKCQRNLAKSFTRSGHDKITYSHQTKDPSERAERVKRHETNQSDVGSCTQ
jgi:hypothetical protein